MTGVKPPRIPGAGKGSTGSYGPSGGRKGFGSTGAVGRTSDSGGGPSGGGGAFGYAKARAARKSLAEAVALSVALQSVEALKREKLVRR